jgi:hypothetical protein
MAQRHLVQARNEDGTPLRRLDLKVLRDALNYLLSEDDDGYLIYQVIVADREPAQVACELNVSHRGCPGPRQSARRAVRLLLL